MRYTLTRDDDLNYFVIPDDKHVEWRTWLDTVTDWSAQFLAPGGPRSEYPTQSEWAHMVERTDADRQIALLDVESGTS